MAALNYTEEWLNGGIDRKRVKEQGPAIEYTLDPQEIYLPFPPSVNAMYRNVQGRGRVKSGLYKDWEEAAGHDLKRQNPKRHKGAVELTIYLQEPDNLRQKDCSNFAKATEDFLVKAGIIEGDGHSIVRSCKQVWSSETRGCRVSIRPAPVHGGAE